MGRLSDVVPSRQRAGQDSDALHGENGIERAGELAPLSLIRNLTVAAR